MRPLKVMTSLTMDQLGPVVPDTISVRLSMKARRDTASLRN
jgi:hypothetical protein